MAASCLNLSEVLNFFDSSKIWLHCISRFSFYSRHSTDIQKKTALLHSAWLAPSSLLIHHAATFGILISLIDGDLFSALRRSLRKGRVLRRDVYLSRRCQLCLVQSVKESLTRGVCAQWCRLFVENPSVIFEQRNAEERRGIT